MRFFPILSDSNRVSLPEWVPLGFTFTYLVEVFLILLGFYSRCSSAISNVASGSCISKGRAKRGSEWAFGEWTIYWLSLLTSNKRTKSHKEMCLHPNVIAVKHIMKRMKVRSLSKLPKNSSSENHFHGIEAKENSSLKTKETIVMLYDTPVNQVQTIHRKWQAQEIYFMNILWYRN